LEVCGRVPSLLIGRVVVDGLCWYLEVGVIKVGEKGEMVRANGLCKDRFCSGRVAGGQLVMQDFINPAGVHRAVIPDFHVRMESVGGMWVSGSEGMTTHPMRHVRFYWADVSWEEASVDVSCQKARLTKLLSFDEQSGEMGPYVSPKVRVARWKVNSYHEYAMWVVVGGKSDREDVGNE
jgi:hypothetical protein